MVSTDRKQREYVYLTTKNRLKDILGSNKNTNETLIIFNYLICMFTFGCHSNVEICLHFHFLQVGFLFIKKQK